MYVSDIFYGILMFLYLSTFQLYLDDTLMPKLESNKTKQNKQKENILRIFSH